jgi:hypothetical protein
MAASMLEIYLEDIKDLLCKKGKGAEPKKHQVTHSAVRAAGVPRLRGKLEQPV